MHRGANLLCQYGAAVASRGISAISVAIGRLADQVVDIDRAFGIAVKQLVIRADAAGKTQAKWLRR